MSRATRAQSERDNMTKPTHYKYCPVSYGKPDNECMCDVKSDVKSMHTPTPWKVVKEIDGHNSETKIVYKDGYCIARTDSHCGRPHVKNIEANARHIVTCVNSHDALVEALKDVLEILEYAEPRNVKTEEKIKAALKMAESET